jgi:hypothetical protein
VETAIRPVPDKSHILNTCPKKAGPVPFPDDFTLVILTLDGNLDTGDKPLATEDDCSEEVESNKDAAVKDNDCRGDSVKMIGEMFWKGVDLGAKSDDRLDWIKHETALIGL